MARRLRRTDRAYLGHGYTSCMTSVDYFVSDGEMAPPGNEHLFSERIMRLPRIPLAYVPPPGMPEASPLPCLTGAPAHSVTSAAPSASTIALWGVVRDLEACSGLEAAPQLSRLYCEAEFANLMRRRFAAHGIGSDRLELVYTSPQPETWKAYSKVDIALDTFPHNAGTTTIEALWLGVPVVSVKDRPSVGRFGASILGSLGLGDWVAGTVDGYVELAVSKALDRQGTAALRQGMRDRFKASPLYDGPGFARSMWMGYRAAWRAWCAKVNPAAVVKTR